MRVLFMGTGPLGLPSLDRLQGSDQYELIGIITQPDRPAGRGMKLRPSPIKTFAFEHNIPCSQPDRIKDDVTSVQQYGPDVVVVAAYGQILTRDIIDIPRLGTINIHASLLPKYRGAAPIQWAIINGERETGISTFFIEEGLDTGDVLIERAIPIEDTDTAGSLHDKLAVLGADVLIETLEGISSGTLSAKPQNHQRATYAPKITKEMARLDWTKSARELFNLIRGLNPMPGAYTFVEKKRLKIHYSHVVDVENKQLGGDAGEVMMLPDEGVVVQTGAGQLLLTEVQPEGKAKMPAADFARGHHVAVGMKLS